MSSDPSDNDATEEDSLLIEAVSLLVRRQRETEAWVAAQIAQTEARASADEQRYAALEARLAGIEDQLGRLLRRFQPSRTDGELDERLAGLRQQVRGLRAEAQERSPLAADTPTATVAISQSAPPSAGGHNHMTAASSASNNALRSAGSVQAVAAAGPRGAQRPPGGTDDAGPRAAEGASQPAARVAAPVAEAASPAPVTQAASPAPVAEAASPASVGAAASPAPVGAAPGGRHARVSDLLGATARERFGVVLIGVGVIAVVYAVLSQLRLGG
ncbi:MAG: hypothetical protein JO352_33995 [Chloroflexi bacterium]|nr:hypothetical protein [Chloroflexota bacterium]MBV9599302.1 hypothetical protein [Chloroflexota bacterium]